MFSVLQFGNGDSEYDLLREKAEFNKKQTQVKEVGI